MPFGCLFCVPLALPAGMSALTPYSLRELHYDRGHSKECGCHLAVALASMVTKAAMHFLKYSLANISWLCDLKPQFTKLYKGTIIASASQV